MTNSQRDIWDVVVERAKGCIVSVDFNYEECQTIIAIDKDLKDHEAFMDELEDKWG